MGEEKFASLSSHLLARKGGAKPAMRRQNYINPQGDVTEDLGWNDMGHEETHPKPVDGEEHNGAPVPEVRKQIDGLAENLDHDPDQVIEAKLPETDENDHKQVDPYGGLTPVQAEPPVESAETPAEEPTNEDLAEPEQPVEPVVAEVTRLVPAKKSKPAEKKVLARDKVAFTLRLDQDRHLKLRLASAVSNRSAQQIVTEALDRYLETMPQINNLADEAPQSERN